MNHHNKRKDRYRQEVAVIERATSNKYKGFKERDAVDNDNSEHEKSELALSHHISNHAAVRYLQRCLDIHMERHEYTANHLDLAVKNIEEELGFKLTDNTHGNFSINEDFILIVRNGIIVTVVKSSHKVPKKRNDRSKVHRL